MSKTDTISADVRRMLDRMDEGFMVPCIEFGNAWEVETECGTSVVPCNIVSERAVVCVGADGEECHVDFDDELQVTADNESAIVSTFRDYIEGEEVFSVTLREGYLARMSAPGYMDCTDWSIFSTAQEAAEHLVDMYGDDEEFDDEEEEAEGYADEDAEGYADEDAAAEESADGA